MERPDERPDSICVLIVDDQEANRLVLVGQMAVLGYETSQAENGLSALAIARQTPPDVILLDIMMPQMDGYEVLGRLKADSALRHIPVVMVSAIDQMESVVQCLAAGAEDYLVKPFNSVLLKARLQNCLEKKAWHDREAEYRGQIEAHNLNLEERVRAQVKEITSTQLATIFAMSNLAESRDPETGEHLDRMRVYCKVLAEHLATQPGFCDVIDQDYIENIYAASPLHDIGKVGIPDRILLKPGKLTRDEFDIMKQHSAIGGDTLRIVDAAYPGNAFVRMGIDIALHHHEKWDGSGYPDGLAGEAIPLAARVLALGDVYDALTSKRCYKEAFSHEKSRDIILADRGTHFDPDVVDAFLALEDVFQDIRARHQDTEKAPVI